MVTQSYLIRRRTFCWVVGHLDPWPRLVLRRHEIAGSRLVGRPAGEPVLGRVRHEPFHGRAGGVIVRSVDHHPGARRRLAAKVARVHSGLRKGVGMAIVVLVLWLFTAGAGFSLLATSNLSRARPAVSARAEEPATASVASTAPAASDTHPASAPEQAASTPAQQGAKRPSRASRDRFAPPSLVAARNAPVLPGLRSLLEFAHPACAIIGLGFWLGYTFVHYRPLGWIAFGLVTATVCLGLSWFAANTRAARRQRQGEPPLKSEHRDESAPSFSTRLIALHGGAAAATFALAALTALVLGR